MEVQVDASMQSGHVINILFSQRAARTVDLLTQDRWGRYSLSGDSSSSTALIADSRTSSQSFSNTSMCLMADYAAISTAYQTHAHSLASHVFRTRLANSSSTILEIMPVRRN